MARDGACRNMRLTAYIIRRILRPMNVTPESLFAALAHPLRLRSLLLLAGEGELCVCELVHVLEVAQPTVSRHLAQLREGGLVSDRREGTWVHYRLHPDLPAWAIEVLRVTAEGLAAEPAQVADHRRLSQMPNRPPRCCA
jgi:ArsR family transcriptional regulator